MTRGNTGLQEHISKLIDSKLFLRLMVTLAIVELGSLALGITFFLIAHGLIFGVLWFVLYWEPAYRVYVRLLRIPETQFTRAPIPWWRAIVLGVKALVVLSFLCLGIRILAANGFLGQNLIYAILTSSK